MDASEGMSAGSRRSWRIAAWVLGSIAVVATAWLAFLLAVIVVEWPTYVGHESSTATAILTAIGVAPTVLAWLVFLVPIVVLRTDRPRDTGAEQSVTPGRKP